MYRRAFYDELKRNEIEFKLVKKIDMVYKGKVYDTKEVRFFIISGLLIAIIAVKNIDIPTISKFSKYVKYYQCQNGLIINFNSMYPDFRYI